QAEYKRGLINVMRKNQCTRMAAACRRSALTAHQVKPKTGTDKSVNRWPDLSSNSSVHMTTKQQQLPNSSQLCANVWMNAGALPALTLLWDGISFFNQRLC
ncbi:hypothetical protein KUCAC02_001938, partial [Chaenocephalus aceratus]